jgi:hypothetical protein
MKIHKSFALVCVTLLALASCGLAKAQGDLFPIKQNQKWGYIDNTGKIVIEPQFQFADRFSEGLAVVEVGHRTYGYIDGLGKFVINPQFRDNAGTFSDGLAIVAIGEATERRAVYIDKTGKTIIDSQLKGGSDFHEGLALVRIAGDKSTASKDRFGYIDKSGKVVINLLPEWDHNEYKFSEGLLAISDKSKGIGYIDRTGKVVIRPQFGPIDTKQVIYTDYSFVRSGEFASFSEGFAPACEGKTKKCGFINKSGNVVVALQFEVVLPFSEGLAAVRIGDRFGFINKIGKVVINPQFDGALKFSEGLARIMIGKKFGYIDKGGKMIVNPQFDYAEDFHKGLAMVTVGGGGREGKVGYIDKRGKYIWNPTN